MKNQKLNSLNRLVNKLIEKLIFKQNIIKLIISSLIFIGATSHAQVIASQSINTSGTKMNQSNGSLSFTFGELLALTQIDNQGNTLNSGFTSGTSVSIINIKEPETKNLSILIFPNPSSDLLNIQINHSTIDQIIVSICDLQGKEIYRGNYATFSSLIGINISEFAVGTYLLAIKNKENLVLGSYKIIKY